MVVVPLNTAWILEIKNYGFLILPLTCSSCFTSYFGWVVAIFTKSRNRVLQRICLRVLDFLDMTKIYSFKELRHVTVWSWLGLHILKGRVLRSDKIVLIQDILFKWTNLAFLFLHLFPKQCWIVTFCIA